MTNKVPTTSKSSALHIGLMFWLGFIVGMVIAAWGYGLGAFIAEVTR